MNVATPTKDCLELIYELLVPVMKARTERRLTRQEVGNLKVLDLVPEFFLLIYFISNSCRKACYWTVKHKWRVYLHLLFKIISR